MADLHGGVEVAAADVDVGQGDPGQGQGAGTAGLAQGQGVLGLVEGLVVAAEVFEDQRGFAGQRGGVERAEPGVYGFDGFRDGCVGLVEGAPGGGVLGCCGQRAGGHGVQAGGEGRDAGALGGEMEAGLGPAGCSCPVVGVQGEMAGARGDVGCERSVAGDAGEGERAGEVLDGELVVGGVVGHPAGHLGKGRGCREDARPPAVSTRRGAIWSVRCRVTAA
ncbi:hypothetical protein ABT237_25275 [Streptomyces sp. NPDC001581]|uniref:hypothetical protein n=1 Tax=Streptomyces sp. NPDC001581 TaxID=3154386 RepID=UPI0033237B21